MVERCPLCSSFAAKSLKGVIRHLGLVHAHEAGFYVRCNVQDCPRTYDKFVSYKKHMYSKHRSILQVQPVSSTRPPDESDEGEGYNSDMDTTTSNDVHRFTRREAALFVLKAKHVHKVAQSSLGELLCDFTTILERSVRDVHCKVSEIVTNIDPALKSQIAMAFKSSDILDPFQGMSTEHKQNCFFKENFDLLVNKTLK